MNPLTELELLRKVLEKVDSHLSSEEILSFALQGVKDTFDLLACSLVVVDSSRSYHKVTLSKGWSNEFIKRFHASPFTGILADFATLREPLVVREGDARHQAEGYRFEHAYAAFTAVPLAIRGKRIGFLYLSSSRKDDFTPERITMLRDVANLCTLILAHGNLEQEVINLSDFDPLTALYSYKYWHEELHRETARADQMENRLSVLAVRLNHLREYNAAVGNAKGDEALRAFSALVRQVSEEIDIPCRSGSKWYVLLTGKDAAAARKVGERLVASAKALPALGDPRLTLSVGAATYEKGEGEIDFVNRAGEALVEARRLGGFSFHAA